MSKQPSLSYKDAGVDIDAGEALVERIKSVAKRTKRPEVMGGLGGFGALCEIPAGYKQPVLVSGTDGVGTKLRLALNLIPLYAVLSAPFIPEAADKMRAAMAIEAGDWPKDVPAALATMPAGHGFSVPDVLFVKITDEQREEWQERFAGKRD